MSREFIREDYLKLELEFKPVLPAREIAIAYLAELDFEVFEPTDLGLIAHIPNTSVSRPDLDSVKQDLESITEHVSWSESIVQTENWNAKWEEEYDPVIVEDKIVVRKFPKPTESCHCHEYWDVFPISAAGQKFLYFEVLVPGRRESMVTSPHKKKLKNGEHGVREIFHLVE